MELLAGDCRKRLRDDFDEDVGSFNGSDEWMYGSRQSENDDALATLADLASPPQKLKPIRSGIKPTSEDRHPLDILAGTLEMLPVLGDGCFDAQLGSKIADVEESGQQLTCVLAKDESLGRNLTNQTSLDNVSLSSSDSSDTESSLGDRKSKRKRKTLEEFLEKLVGKMMKRQEKMHNEMIKTMEMMERERIRREEAWREQESERTKQNEEARKQEMARSLSLISFINNTIGEEIEIPKPFGPSSQRPHKKSESAEKKQRSVNHLSGKRWPQEEVQALIDSRSEVDEKTANRGVIWDDISSRMKSRGYERSAKKCKEKWENMNKYYRRVIVGGKKLPENSKTHAYFHKLDRLYKTGEKLQIKD